MAVAEWLQSFNSVRAQMERLVSSLHSLLMQLCALKTHIRISRSLKKIVDLMRNHRSGREPSPCPLQAQASGSKNLRKSHCGLQWLCVTSARQVDWLARLLAATLSQQYDRGSSNSQSDFISMLFRRLCLPYLCNRHFLEVSNTRHLVFSSISLINVVQ